MRYYPTMERHELSVLIYKQGDFWLARALEHDMLAQGDTPLGAFSELEIVIQAYQQKSANILDFEPAAAKYKEMFERGLPLSVQDLIRMSNSSAPITKARILAA